MKIKAIIFDVNVKTKADLFVYIAKEFSNLGVVSDEHIYLKSLITREAEYSTGLTDGIAIPHGKSPTVLEHEVLFIKLRTPMDYGTLDDSKVQYVFALAIAQMENNHLDMLMELSVKLMHSENIERLEQAQNAEDIAAIFA
ncbi:PTS mannose transporter subunit IIAB [Erysipelotrichaceae bacterium]|nr:PTS mannose transporter subunit IIAB [Erysipelotrichaceae bacterium]